jgi:hypothetical protein
MRTSIPECSDDGMFGSVFGHGEPDLAHERLVLSVAFVETLGGMVAGSSQPSLREAATIQVDPEQGFARRAARRQGAWQRIRCTDQQLWMQRISRFGTSCCAEFSNSLQGRAFRCKGCGGHAMQRIYTRECYGAVICP